MITDPLSQWAFCLLLLSQVFRATLTYTGLSKQGFVLLLLLFLISHSLYFSILSENPGNKEVWTKLEAVYPDPFIQTGMEISRATESSLQFSFSPSLFRSSGKGYGSGKPTRSFRRTP